MPEQIFADTPQGNDYKLYTTYKASLPSSGETTMELDVFFVNEGYVRGIDFTIEYPEGMMTTKSKKKYPITISDKSRFDTGDDATVSVNAASGTNVTFTNNDLDLIEPCLTGRCLTSPLLKIPVTLDLSRVDINLVQKIRLTQIKAYVTNDESTDLKTVKIPDITCYFYPQNSPKTTFARAGYMTYESARDIWELEEGYQVFQVKEFTIAEKANGSMIDLKYLGRTIPPYSKVIVKCPKSGDCNVSVLDEGSVSSCDSKQLIFCYDLYDLESKIAPTWEAGKGLKWPYQYVKTYVLSENDGIVGFYWWGTQEYEIDGSRKQATGNLYDGHLLCPTKGFFVETENFKQ